MTRPIFQRVLTSADLYEQSYLDNVNAIAQDLVAKVKANSKILPADTEIVIGTKKMPAWNSSNYGYYLASWSHKSILWLQEMPVFVVTNDDRPVVAESQLCACVSAPIFENY